MEPVTNTAGITNMKTTQQTDSASIGSGSDLAIPVAHPSESPQSCGYPFRVRASYCSLAESSIYGSVYEEWLTEMAAVDPRHIVDITEGLVRRHLIAFKNLSDNSW